MFKDFFFNKIYILDCCENWIFDFVVFQKKLNPPTFVLSSHVGYLMYPMYIIES